MRTPITLKIKFKSASIDQFIERYSVDVSRGGIFIRTKEPLAVGTPLRFEFQLQDSAALIAGQGTVVWIREHDPARGGVAPGMGVRFDKVAPDSQPVLEQILSEKQKRGDTQMESRFEAGVRASASAATPQGSGGPGSSSSDDFGGDVRAHHTPLPLPVPGLDGADDDFGQESTRVMQNEVVQALADRSREDEFAENIPTRAGSPEELSAAQAKLRAPESMLERPGVEVDPSLLEPAFDAPKAAPTQSEAKPSESTAPPPAAVAAPAPQAAPVEAPEAQAAPVATASASRSEPADTPPAKTAAAPEPSSAPQAASSSAAKEPAKEPARAAAAPPPKKSSSMSAVLMVLAVAGAIGGYVFTRSGEEAPSEATSPSEPAQAGLHEVPKAEPTLPAPDQPTAPTEPAVPAAPSEPAAAVPTQPAAPVGPSVEITSEPAGAQVLLDGEAQPQPTPATLTGLDEKKTYELRLVLKGHREWKGKLTPKAGARVAAKLIESERRVEIASTPTPVDVMLDGKKVGRTPFTLRKLDWSRPHELELKRAGFVAQSRTLSASDAFETKGEAEVLAIAVTLEPVPRAAPKPTPVRPAAKKPVVEARPVAVQPPPVRPVVAEPAVADKPVADKPVADKPVADKPVAAEPAVADKPVADKPAADKPAASPEDKSEKQIKVPAWMRKTKAAEDAPAAPSTEPTP